MCLSKCLHWPLKKCGLALYFNNSNFLVCLRYLLLFLQSPNIKIKYFFSANVAIKGKVVDKTSYPCLWVKQTVFWKDVICMKAWNYVWPELFVWLIVVTSSHFRKKLWNITSPFLSHKLLIPLWINISRISHLLNEAWPVYLKYSVIQETNP